MLVVTVCTANLCRSPLAEHVLRKSFEALGAAVDVASAGVQARPGQVVPEDWVQVAEGFGIDLAAHRSERVDALIDTADLFVVMTADHARDLAMLDRRALGRIVTLSGASERIGRACAAGTLPGSLVGDQRGLDVLNMNRSGDVPDPYRQARREQQRIAAHIVELCERLAGGWSR